MNQQKRIYISGKISGIEEVAGEFFSEAERYLLSLGFGVINPMKLEHNHDKKWESYMREDIKGLMECDAIYMLSNWEVSRGAKIEHHLATVLGMDILYQDYPPSEMKITVDYNER
jgi:predicted outer membrane lipoprotein